MPTVTKCRESLLLTKNRLTKTDDYVDFSETAVNSCDNSKQFDDGMNRENIKCTTTRERVGTWSHKQYSCHGITIGRHNDLLFADNYRSNYTKLYIIAILSVSFCVFRRCVCVKLLNISSNLLSARCINRNVRLNDTVDYGGRSVCSV